MKALTLLCELSNPLLLLLLPIEEVVMIGTSSPTAIPPLLTTR